MNEHVVTYCKEYLKIENNPNFALLIKGKWGCGKTYFIDKIISDSKDIINDNEIIKISLYGISTIQQLDERMYQAIHPILSSKTVKILGALLRTSLKYGTTVDFNNDGSDDATITFGGVPEKKSVKLTKINKKLIIVDDFERTNLDATAIFGYFSEYIISFGLRAIFIGNEEEIYTNDINKKDKYNKVKEKIIGIEFKIQPDIESALNTFINDLRLNSYNEIIKETVIDVIYALKYENLRNIWQCLYNLKILIDILPETINEDHLKDIINSFGVLFLQKNQGEIKSENTYDALTIYKRKKIDYKTYIKEERKKDDLVYNLYFNKIYLEKCWESIIFEGNYSKDYIIKEYNKEIEDENPDNNNSLYYILNNWRDLEKDKFKESIEKLESDFNAGKYLHPGDILHYVNIIYIFINMRLIDKAISEVNIEIDNFIEEYKRKIIIELDPEVYDEAYKGWGYSKDTEIQKIREKLKKIIKENYAIEIKKEIIIKIDNNEIEIKDFCNDIRKTYGNNKYYNIPIINVIGEERFYKLLNQNNGHNQKRIIRALTDRYDMNYSNGELRENYYDDYITLKKVYKKLKKNRPEIKYNPQGVQFNEMMNDLDQILKYFEKIIKKKK